MGLTRSSIVKGPAIVVCGGYTYWSQDDIALNIDDGIVELSSSVYGPRTDGILVNPKASFTFTPHACVKTGPTAMSRLEATTALVPSIFLTGAFGAQYLGSGGSEATWQIWSVSNGDLWTIYNGIITAPPSITYSADKPIFGQMTVTGITKTNSSDINLGMANSIFRYQASQSNPGLAWQGVASYLQRRYKCKLGSQTGYTEIWPEGGITISFKPSWKERQIQGLTIDFELAGMEIMARLVPTGPTPAQIVNLLGIGSDNGASWAQGALASSQQSTHSFTVQDPSDSSEPFVLNKPIIRKPGFVFSHSALRNGELGFQSIARFTAGAQDALASIA